MNLKCLALVLLMCSPFVAWADNTASEESIRELMVITQSEKLLDGTMLQMDGWMKQSMQQAMGGEELSAAQEEIAQQMRDKMLAIIKKNMSWVAMESRFIELYKKTFTQSEIDGMIDFYKSDAGKAVVAKMPLVMQSSMEMVQTQMREIMPEMQQLTRETVKKMIAADKQQTASDQKD